MVPHGNCRRWTFSTLSELVNWMYHASIKEEKRRDQEKKKSDERAKRTRLRNAVQDYLV
jgi:hypothetical protein